MAKIRVAQIKDLSLTDAAQTGFASLEVGTTTKDVLTSIAEGTPAEGTTQSGIMTGITVAGNTITPKYKSLTELSLYTKQEVDSAISTSISNAIDALDTTADVTIASVADGVVTLKPGIAQENGLIKEGTTASITLAKVATTGAAVDVSVAPIIGLNATNVQAALAELQGDIDSINDQTITAVENQAVQVNTTGGNTTIGLKLADGEQVLSQTVNGLKSTIALAYDPTTTKIKLTGINGADLGTIDASNFVKDGILQDVVIVEGTGAAEDGQTEVLVDGHRYFKFTYKTVYYDENEGTVDSTKVVYLDVETLVDTYTAGNKWIEIDKDTNTISHKLSDVIISAESQTTPDSLTVGTSPVNSTPTVVDNAGETVKFKVPTITVDRAGHVIYANESEITITLPSYIGTAVQTITGETAELNNSNYVNVKAEKTVDAEGAVEYTLTSKVKTQTLAGASAGDDGLATALDVKKYVDASVSKASHKHIVQEGVYGVTPGYETNVITLTNTPYEGFETIVYQNGIALRQDEWNLVGTTLTLKPEVTLVEGDEVKISYYYTANVNA